MDPPLSQIRKIRVFDPESVGHPSRARLPSVQLRFGPPSNRATLIDDPVDGDALFDVSAQRLLQTVAQPDENASARGVDAKLAISRPLVPPSVALLEVEGIGCDADGAAYGDG